jgi:hypothetical protein
VRHGGSFQSRVRSNARGFTRGRKEARRSTGQATGDRAAMRPVGLSPPCVVGDVALPTGGGPTCSASSASVRLDGRRPVFSCSASRATSWRLLGSARLGEIAAPRLVTLTTRVFALWRSPCVSERASSEVPGCGHASCRCAHGLVPASARSLANGRGWVASHQTRLRCLGPRTGWRPAWQPFATARSRRVTFHPYKGTERALTVPSGIGEKARSAGRGRGARS